MCKEIVLDLVYIVLEENRSDVKIKYDEDDAQEALDKKRKCQQEK